MDLLQIFKSINKVLWGPPLMILLGGFGVVSSIYLGFPQFSKFGIGWKHSFGKIFSKKKNLEKKREMDHYHHSNHLQLQLQPK